MSFTSSYLHKDTATGSEVFGTEMASFAVALQSLFVICAILSDYLTAFDQWILTTPIPNQLGKDRLSWTPTLTTCIAYATFEPLCYWIMVNISNLAMWWFIMACWVHISFGVTGYILIIGRIALQIKERHMEACAPQLQTISSAHDTDENLALQGVRHTGTTSDGKAFTHEMEDGKQYLRTDVTSIFPLRQNHYLPLEFRLAPLLPIATTAATNAGLLFYTRYLSTEESQAWLTRFSFGWIAIALVSILCFCMAKIANRAMQSLRCKENQNVTLSSTGFLKFASITTIVLFRAFVRHLLSLEPLTTISKFPDKSGLHLSGSLKIGEESRDTDGDREHGFDRFLAGIPPWVGPVMHVMSILFTLGLFIRRKYQTRHDS